MGADGTVPDKTANESCMVREARALMILASEAEIRMCDVANSLVGQSPPAESEAAKHGDDVLGVIANVGDSLRRIMAELERL